MKNFSLLLFALFLLSLLACRSNSVGHQSGATAFAAPETACCYTQADVQKLQWLSGAWQARENGRSLELMFLFHGDNLLEVLDFDRADGATTSLFTWYNGRYYFGPKRQWSLTWIGEKDVRLDPAVNGVDPMTWTRIDEHSWHLVRHTAQGDKTVVFERAAEMQP